MKPPLNSLVQSEVENLFGDSHPLMEQIGTSDGLSMAGAVNASLRLDRVSSLGDLRNFLKSYRTEILLPLELPLICQAYAHASRNEFSELTILDRQLAEEPRLGLFASASKRIGQTQLERLRPLRDQRGLQRYIHAVDAKQAFAWHTLVYGVTLASFLLPVRQGLLNYTEQVLAGFIHSSGNYSRFSRMDCEELLKENIAIIPPLIDGLLVRCELVPQIQVA